MSVQAKIATVMNEHEVALNVGAIHGVNVNDIATVWDEWNVTDPDSEQPLGTIRRPRVRFRITTVMEHLAIGSTYEYVEKPANERTAMDRFTTAGFFEHQYRMRIADHAGQRDFRTAVVGVGTPVEVETPAADSD